MFLECLSLEGRAATKPTVASSRLFQSLTVIIYCTVFDCSTMKYLGAFGLMNFYNVFGIKTTITTTFNK